ncbi:hypothetical protein [Maridesulfovibrio ferrireducens]|uniref:hypothetical protein n=1 Tax=Maridesulfovibrio ferrireducens TaxID=246191 RepID=UPI001A191546|nr:hypothetical protein [Maridesulfovibrio ferrireducens]MBI9110007.1 hypothetical protein [Maridesulfovibrio ferrireducens]
MSWETFAAKPRSIKIYTAEISVADPANPTAEREVLRFSSDGIDPALSALPYSPCIASLPTFTRSLQSMTYGRTTAAFGNMVLLTGGGHLDSFIHDYIFAGAPVVIKSGFDGLDVSEFKEIFSGRVTDAPTWNDTKLTLSLADGVRDLLDHKLTEQTLSGVLPTVVSGLLDAAGITADKRDSAMWDAWKAENNFSIWLPISANQTLGNVLDLLLSPLASWYTFDRSGLFRIATFAGPEAEAVPVLELTDLELTKFSEKNHGKHTWKVVVTYYTATGASSTTAETSWEDSTIKDLNPVAVEMSKNTVLTALADANTVRDRWKELFFVRRLVATAVAKTRLFGVNMGDHVHIFRDRLNINDMYRVTKIIDNATKNSVTLELMR